MSLSLNLDSSQQEVLDKTLSTQKNAMTYNQLHGFLFGVCSSPTPLIATEWMPLVFGGDLPKQSTAVDASVKIIMALYNIYNSMVSQDKCQLPEFCIWHQDEDLRQPLSEWFEGLLMAHNWLSEFWLEAIEAFDAAETDKEISLADEIQSSLALFIAFSKPERAAQDMGDPQRLWQTLPNVFQQMPSMLQRYASYGRVFCQAAKRQIARDGADPSGTYWRDIPKVGRNDLCPCGSGKKFKKCCMALT